MTSNQSVNINQSWKRSNLLCQVKEELYLVATNQTNP